MISIVILSYNTKELTRKCLECLGRAENVETEVIVIDNASGDGSGQMIKSEFKWVKFVQNKDNVGFAKGCNQGMAMAKGEYILLLNSDAFVFEDTLELLMDFANKTPEADVVGCKLVYADGMLQPTWGYFPTIRRIAQMMGFIDNLPGVKRVMDSIHVRDEVRYETSRQVDWVTGAFTLLKREVFEKIGGIDENYFMYGEEMEWMYRIKQAGFKVWFTPQAECVHLEGKSSTDRSGAVVGEMKGWIYWFSKHGTPTQVKIVARLIQLGCWLRINIRRKNTEAYRKAMNQISDEVFARTNSQNTSGSV